MIALPTDVQTVRPRQPVPAKTLMDRARQLYASNRPAAARPLIAAARRLGVDPTDADLLEAQLLLQAGQPDAAVAMLDRAVMRTPTAVALRLARAEARLLAHDAAGAAADAAEAVIAAPGNADAKASLGIALADLGQFDDAVACLRDAIGGNPAKPVFRLALARAHECRQEFAVAAAVLDDGILHAPGSLALRNAAIRLAIDHQAFDRAVALTQEARRVGVLDATMLGMLGYALTGLGQRAEAGRAFADAFSLAPEDPCVRHLASANGHLPAAPRAPDEYIRRVFDRGAEHFDLDLISLRYRVPGLMRQAVLKHVALPTVGLAGPILDLGCGTGLVAVALSDLPLGPWHGVDLSPAMLARAESRKLYETQQEASLETALATPGPDYPLMFAADVLIYFGVLDSLFAAIYRRLLPGGKLMASTESLDDGADWRLRPQGRYAHAADYIARTAAGCGFVVRSLEPETVRMEGGRFVPGLMAVLAKPRL